MTLEADGQLQIKTSLNQFIKTYSVYNPVSNLLEELYEAATGVAHGQPCMKTTYEYDGASSRILKTKEEISTWDSAWDI